MVDRMERQKESEAYITIKERNENFRQKTTFRLINPSKSEIGKVI